MPTEVLLKLPFHLGVLFQRNRIFIPPGQIQRAMPGITLNVGKNTVLVKTECALGHTKCYGSWMNEAHV